MPQPAKPLSIMRLNKNNAFFHWQVGHILMYLLRLDGPFSFFLFYHFLTQPFNFKPLGEVALNNIVEVTTSWSEKLPDCPTFTYKLSIFFDQWLFSCRFKYILSVLFQHFNSSNLWQWLMHIYGQTI